jgi:hypothetical protein
MPTLRNPRREAFAQARAGGALLDDAYEAAGFAPGNRHASRLAGRPEADRRASRRPRRRPRGGRPRRDRRSAPAGRSRLGPGGAAALGEACLALVQARKLMGEARGARDGGPIR